MTNAFMSAMRDRRAHNALCSACAIIAVAVAVAALFALVRRKFVRRLD